MADNSNITPNDNNPIEPPKKRYILPTSKSSQNSSTTPYPQSLNNSDNLAQKLKAKFARPEPKPEAPKAIPVTLQNEETIITPTPTPTPPQVETQIETKKFRYQENKQEFALPVVETPKVNPDPIRETVIIEEPKPQAIPINLGTETQSIAESIVPKQEAKIEPTIQTPIEPIIEPKIEKVELKVKPNFNVNPLPTEIEAGAKQAVAESKEAETPTIELNKPEEPVNKVDDVKKYSLPGTETDPDSRTESKKIMDEITSKFAPKAEVKIEETKQEQNVLESLIEQIDEKVVEPITNIEVPEVVKETVVFEAPKIEPPQIDIKLDVNPLPPEIDRAVKESQIPDLDTQQVVEVTKPEKPVNEVVKNNKYSLPGIDNGDSGYQTPSEKIRQELLDKFRPKAKTTQQVAKEELSLSTPAAEATTAATTAPIVTPAILDGIKPLIKFNEEEPTSNSDFQDTNTDSNQDTPITATEFLKQEAEAKPEPKYQLRQDTITQEQSPIIESAAVAAGAIGSAIGSIDIGSKVDTAIDDAINDIQESQTTGTLNSNSGISRIISNKGGSTGSVTSTGISQSADPNRYISSPQTTSGGRTQTTQTTTTTTISDITTGKIIKFNLSRKPIRSAKGGNNSGSKKGRFNAAKAGLIALALTLNQGGAIAQESGIFDGVNEGGYAVGTQVDKPNTNFLTDENNVGPKYQPTSINEFGQKQGTYDADGKFTESPKAITDPSDPNYSRAKKPKVSNTEDGIPALGSNKKDEQGFADQGAYDSDGKLRQALVSGDAVDLNQVNRPKQPILDNDGNAIPQLSQEQRETNAINNAPGAIPTGAPAGGIPGQTSPQGGPAVPAPAVNASQVAPSADENKGAELNSAKKESLGNKLKAAIVNIFLKQGIALITLILLTLFMITGIALWGGSIFLAGICSDAVVVNLALAGGLAGNQGADAIYKTCQAFTALTGVGCGSAPDTKGSSTECIADYLDSTGDTLTLNGIKGDVKVKKSIIKKIMKEGHAAFPDNNELIQYMVAIYPVVAAEKDFGTKNGDCLGVFKICKKDYDKAIEGLDVKDTGDFLNSSTKQIKAFGKLYLTKKATVGNQEKCAQEFFEKDKKTFDYKLFYSLLANGCPDKEDEFKVQNWFYADKASANFKKTDCIKFKDKIKLAYDMTPYYSVANSISSIGSYIGNGLNKFNLSLSITAEAQKSINPTGTYIYPAESLKNAKKGYATKAETDQLIQFINSGKLVADYSGFKRLFIADILGDNITPRGMRNSGPIHTNTAKFLIHMANTGLKPRISSLANNTHNYNKISYHHTDPGLGVDFAGFNGQDGMPDNTPTDVVAPFLKAAGESKLVKQFLTNRNTNNKQRFDALNTGLNIGLEGNPNHFHFSIDPGGVIGSDNLPSKAECPEVNVGRDSKIPIGSDGKPGPAGPSDLNTRLNKKSIPLDKNWQNYNSIYSREDTEENNARQIKIQTEDGGLLNDFQDQDVKRQLKSIQLFKSDEATRAVYKQALIEGLKFRNVALQNELTGKGPYALKTNASKQLKRFFEAMAIDGIKPKMEESFLTAEETRIKFEKTFDEVCKREIKQSCMLQDIIDGKRANELKETFKLSEVPNMSLRSTGLIADIIPSDLTDKTKFKSSLMYKYITEDNQLNLKRFGFILVNQDSNTSQGPIIVENQIIYVKRLQLANPDLETDFPNLYKELTD